MRKELIKPLILLIENKAKLILTCNFKIMENPKIFADLFLDNFELSFEITDGEFFLKQIYRDIDYDDHIELYFNENKHITNFYYMNLYQNDNREEKASDQEATLFVDNKYNKVNNNVIYDIICNDILKVIINEL